MIPRPQGDGASKEPRDDRRGLRMLDLAALVVGYGLAAMGVRAFWPYQMELTAAVLIPLGLAYLWLGLAMSGPFVLLFDRRPRPPGAGGPVGPRPGRGPGVRPMPSPEADTPRFTRAESAWLVIGGYWIGMAMLVLPQVVPRLPMALVGLLPVLAAGVLWLLGPRRSVPTSEGTAWTHRAAVVLLASWPLAWACLIVLTRVLA